MYAVARLDGVGERVMQAVLYMASASFYNLRFGGFVYKESYDTGHHTHGMAAADTLHLMTEYMGSNFSALRLRVPNPRFDHCWRGGLEEGDKFNFVAGETALINDDCTGLHERKDLFLLNQPFLQRLRQSTTLLDRPTKYFTAGKGQLRIAIHLRRGDILHTTRDWWPGPDRLVPDAIYVGLLSLLRGMFGPAEIHVFSTSSSNFPNASFNRFRQPGVHVHLDGDILDDWAHMAQADILAVAPSGFSWVAGLLNSRCVVTFKAFPWGYLPRWIQLNDDFRQAGQLRSCIRDKGLLPREKNGSSCFVALTEQAVYKFSGASMSLLASETHAKVAAVQSSLSAVESHLAPLLAKNPKEVARHLGALENAELQARVRSLRNMKIKLAVD
ncbi:unnamed protein product [Symbiodinium sp. CCMP2592]|nr:unnamed protein product [Symbiodinium sp. CCMP2592]